MDLDLGVGLGSGSVPAVRVLARLGAGVVGRSLEEVEEGTLRLGIVVDGCGWCGWRIDGVVVERDVVTGLVFRKTKLLVVRRMVGCVEDGWYVDEGRRDCGSKREMVVISGGSS